MMQSGSNYCWNRGKTAFDLSWTSCHEVDGGGDGDDDDDDGSNV